MKIAAERDYSLYAIRTASAGQVVVEAPLDLAEGGIEEEMLTSNTIIMPRKMIREWAQGGLATLNTEDFNPLIALQPEVVLLGTGEKQTFPEYPLYSALTTSLGMHGIGLEVMDTPAACRTYNILSYEGRAVAAALLI